MSTTPHTATTATTAPPAQSNRDHYTPLTENERDALKAHELNQKYEKAIKEEHQQDDLSLRTKETFRDSAVMAANEIVYLALHSPKDNIRLAASQYVVDRVLGPLPKAGAPAGDEFADFLTRMSSTTP